jgi:hypothetical protein
MIEFKYTNNEMTSQTTSPITRFLVSLYVKCLLLNGCMDIIYLFLEINC